jgi:hypothetical protein
VRGGWPVAWPGSAQDLGAVQQVDVLELELHLQVEGPVIGDSFEQFQGFGLLGGQP